MLTKSLWQGTKSTKTIKRERCIPVERNKKFVNFESAVMKHDESCNAEADNLKTTVYDMM